MLSGDDILLLLAWGIFAVMSCQVTLHLYRDLGVLVASQAFVMTLAALAHAQMIRAGADPTVGLAVSIIVGVLLGLLHVPILLQVGPYLILVVTAIAQIVLAQFWLAMPYITGGSGGLLLPSNEARIETLAAVVALALSIFYIVGIVGKRERAFDFACIRSSGMKAGALGVSSLRFYVFGFALYGLTLAVCGAAAVRLLGYLTPDLFGLSWALTSVLIALIAKDRSFSLMIALAVLYAAIRIGLRQIVMASPAWSHGLEMLFPALLLVFFAMSVMRAQRPPHAG